MMFKIQVTHANHAGTTWYIPFYTWKAGRSKANPMHTTTCPTILQLSVSNWQLVCIWTCISATFMRWPPVQLCTYVCMYICTPLCTMYCIQPLVHTLKFLQLYSDFASASTSCPTGKEASTVCELSALEVAWQAFQRTYAMGKQTMLILMYIDIN